MITRNANGRYDFESAQHEEIVYHVMVESGVTACRQSILSMSGVNELRFLYCEEME